MGNLFIFMFAGHEANANTLMFTLLLLACHPSIQKLLQQDIDKIQSHATSDDHNWSYESIYPALTESMVFAVINETLRVASVLPFLPKIGPKGSPQSIKIADHTHIIPANTLIIINVSATHQHPNYWPQPRNSQVSAMPSNPVASFNPQYWLGSRDAYTQGSSQPHGFLRPQPGSFVPFSDGSRGCLGSCGALRTHHTNLQRTQRGVGSWRRQKWFKRSQIEGIVGKDKSKGGVSAYHRASIWYEFALQGNSTYYFCEKRTRKVCRHSWFLSKSLHPYWILRSSTQETGPT